MAFTNKNGAISMDSQPISTKGQPGPMKTLKNMVRDSAKSLYPRKNSPTITTKGQPGPFGVIKRAVKGQISDAKENTKSLINARMDRKMGDQYESIKKKIQRGRGIPKEVIFQGGAKDPARQAAVEAFHAKGEYNRLQKGNK